MITLLCIDDSKEVQIIVKKTFTNSARILPAESLSEAQTQLKNNQVDLILLDLSLPDGDGFEFFNKLNLDESLSKIPVIILTSKNQIQDKVMGFHLGAEDFIVKPFDPSELKVRVEARVKRHLLFKEHDSIMQVGNLVINHLEQSVNIKENDSPEDITLTTTEFKILSYLAKHKDQVMSREQIISSAWKHGFNISDRTIDSHISRIRKKIATSNHNIIAIQSVGYKFSVVKNHTKAA
jgi:DNA-binding response OmpR family regulator